MAEHSTVNRRVTGSSPVGGANIARAPERSSGALAIYVPLARTSNPSGLRPRRGKDFWFLARSENLRLASSSPVGTFPLSREPVTTPPYAGAGALPPGPRAYALGGITVFTSSRARKNRHPAVSSPEQQGSVGGSKDASPRKNVKSKAQRSSSPTSTTRLPNARRGSGASAFSYAYSKANPQGQPNPESYACSSTQPPESRKYLKR